MNRHKSSGVKSGLPLLTLLVRHGRGTFARIPGGAALIVWPKIAAVPTHERLHARASRQALAPGQHAAAGFSADHHAVQRGDRRGALFWSRGPGADRTGAAPELRAGTLVRLLQGW